MKSDGLMDLAKKVTYLEGRMLGLEAILSGIIAGKAEKYERPSEYVIASLSVLQSMFEQVDVSDPKGQLFADALRDLAEGLEELALKQLSVGDVS